MPFFVPGDLDLWPSNSSERGTKHLFNVNLAQIRLVVPEVFHTQTKKSTGFASWQHYCTALKLCGVEHRAPPIFSRAAITLGTGPQSSLSMRQNLAVTWQNWLTQVHLENGHQNVCVMCNYQVQFQLPNCLSHTSLHDPLMHLPTVKSWPA